MPRLDLETEGLLLDGAVLVELDRAVAVVDPPAFPMDRAHEMPALDNRRLVSDDLASPVFEVAVVDRAEVQRLGALTPVVRVAERPHQAAPPAALLAPAAGRVFAAWLTVQTVFKVVPTLQPLDRAVPVFPAARTAFRHVFGVVRALGWLAERMRVLALGRQHHQQAGTKVGHGHAAKVAAANLAPLTERLAPILLWNALWESYLEV